MGQCSGHVITPRPEGGRVLLEPGEGCLAVAGIISLPPNGERAGE